MKKLIYHVGTTLDNFICQEDGSIVGFLADGDHIPDYLESLKNYDTVLMGKSTYEFGYGFGLNTYLIVGRQAIYSAFHVMWIKDIFV